MFEFYMNCKCGNKLDIDLELCEHCLAEYVDLDS